MMWRDYITDSCIKLEAKLVELATNNRICSHKEMQRIISTIWSIVGDVAIPDKMWSHWYPLAGSKVPLTMMNISKGGSHVVVLAPCLITKDIIAIFTSLYSVSILSMVQWDYNKPRLKIMNDGGRWQMIAIQLYIYMHIE